MAVNVDVDAWIDTLSKAGLLPGDSLCVLAAGSLIRGWGNASSDLDLYVITDKLWTGDHIDNPSVHVRAGAVPSASFFARGLRLDVEYWQEELIVGLIQRVSWAQYDSGAMTDVSLSRTEIDVLERLTYGVPLLGSDWLSAQRAAVKNSALTVYLVRHRLNMADIFVEDARGQLASGDVECAVLSARAALGHSVDALLASAGEIGHATKWRPRRFRAVQQDILSFDEYWRLETMATYDPRRPADGSTGVAGLPRHRADGRRPDHDTGCP